MEHFLKCLPTTCRRTFGDGALPCYRRGIDMYELWDPHNQSIREKVYSDAAEYGVVCRIRDLKEVVDGVDKFLKKTKVRDQGLCKRFGQPVLCSEFDTGIICH